MGRNIRNLTAAALFIAIGLVLPMAFHFAPQLVPGVPLGAIFLPMHIPVLMSGLILGWKYGLIVGLITPVLSHFTMGMPAWPMLQTMFFELAVYGLVTGLLVKVIRTRSMYVNLYVAMIVAMIAGRVTFGLLNMFFFQAGTYTLQIWLNFALLAAWPGIMIQLVFVPSIVFAIKKLTSSAASY